MSDCRSGDLERGNGLESESGNESASTSGIENHTDVAYDLYYGHDHDRFLSETANAISEPLQNKNSASTQSIHPLSPKASQPNF